MNIRSAIVAACALLAGCAGYSGYTAPNDQTIVEPQAASTSSGSSSGGQQAAGGPRERTREQVQAEAVDTVKHYQSTQQQERDWFNPLVR